MDGKVLVIGYGSTLRGDDAVGPRVAELLETHAQDWPNVTVRVEASLTPELAAAAAEAERVVFIDCAADLAPGKIVEYAVDAEGEGSPAMVHFLNPAALLRWTRELYGRAPEAVQFAIGGGSFEINDALTPPVALAGAEVERRVSAMLDRWAQETEAVGA